MLDVVHVPKSIDEAPAFHRAVVVAAQNRALLNAWQTMGIEVLTTVSLATTSTPLLDLAQEHIPIAQALHDGDAKKASTLLRNRKGEYGIRARRLTRRSRPRLTTATGRPRRASCHGRRT